MGKLAEIARAVRRDLRIRVGLPFITYEVRFNDVLGGRSADERIEKLDQIKTDLVAATDAVDILKEEAIVAKRQAEELIETVGKLQEDKKAAEKVLTVPEEALARLLDRANSRGRARAGSLSAWSSACLQVFFRA